jgi:hypothetical protein
MKKTGSSTVSEETTEIESVKTDEAELDEADHESAEEEIAETEADEPAIDEEAIKEEAEAAARAAEADIERLAAEQEAARLELEAEAKKIADEAEKRRLAFEQAKIYDVEVTTLTTRDCIRCHVSQYTRIVKEGGRHSSVVCTDCHREYHAYNPLKANFKDIMPKCVWCHNDPHGEERAVLRCLNCHVDPHQPVFSVPDPSQFEDNCGICHATIATLLQENPSKHTQQPCSSCHSEKHGRIPECSACHENHSPKVDMKTPDCMACHPVHTPLQISYPITQNKELCGGCHDKPYQDLEERVTKHSALTCAKCHPQHGKLMACQDCHGEFVHDRQIHKRFESCGECHSVAHKLDM